MKHRPFLLWLVMLLVSAALSLVAAEFLARNLFELELPVHVGSGSARLSDEENRAAFVGDPELLWRLRPDVELPDREAPLRGLVSNAQGLREPTVISGEKAPNELRILFIGDSITFGWGVRHDETFVDRTEQLLRERFPGVATVAINAGVPAYSVLQGWRYLAGDGFDLQPDLVVLGSFGFNDWSSWGDLSDYEHLERWRAWQAPEALRWSRLAQLLASRMSSVPNTPGTGGPRPRLLADEFREILNELRAAMVAHGTELVVVVHGREKNLDGFFPKDTRDPYQTALIELGRSLRLGPQPEPALVDATGLLQALAEEHPRDELLLDTVHPSAFVHAAVAEQVAERIAPWIETQIRFGRVTSSEVP